MYAANKAVEITQISFVHVEYYAVNSWLVVLFYTRWTLGHQLIASIWVLPGIVRLRE